MARRRYQQGRMFLRGKPGQRKWIGRFRVDVIGQDGQVRRKERSVILGPEKELTEKLARRKLEPFLATINSSEYRASRVATVGEFAERWKLEVLVQRKKSTIYAAQSHLKAHIIPQLGSMRLDELGQELLQQFSTRLSRKMSRKTLRNVLSTLASMLGTARKWNYASKPVKMRDLVLPDCGERKDPRFFTAEESARIISAAADPFRTMFSILATTGLRAGELMALKVDDLDFKQRLIFVRRAVSRGQVQSVKSKASRKPLPIPDALADILRDYLKGWRDNPERWLFVNRRGGPFSGDKVTYTKLRPLLEQLGIERGGLHAFRHGHSSLLLNVGAPATVTQEQMRHSDARVTLGIYGHVIGDSQREAVEKVAQRILRPTAPKLQESGKWIQ